MATIEKRGDSYRIIVSCGFDVNGKRIKRSMTWKPDRAYTPKQLEKALNKAAVEFEEKVLSGEVAADSRLKLVDFIPQYMESAKLKQVAARLGHSQLSTTNRYLHAIQEADRTIADSLGDTLTALKQKRA